MAVAASLYGNALLHFAKGEIAFLADDIKVVLLQAGYVLDQDAHESYADIVASEVATGAGYTARGTLLQSRAVTYDAPTNRTRLWADNAFWVAPTGQTLTASHAVIYKDSGTNSTSWLIGYVDFGTTVSAIGAPLTIDWDDDDGLLFVEVA